MAVRTPEELLAAIKERIGDDTSDEALTLIEDISDTINTKNRDDKEDWKKKYEENDAAWRQKYRERFFNPPTENEKDDEEIEEKSLTNDELFKEE